MQDVRCPDCGYRLKTNQCPICLKRVPFPGLVKEKTRPTYTKPRQVETEIPERKIHIPVNMGTFPQKHKTKKKSKPAAVVAIVLAVISVLSSLGELIESTVETSYEPEYNLDAFIQAGTGEASHVPQMESQEIYNANGIVITAEGLGLYYDDYAIPVTVVNNSEQDITVSTEMLSVNSYMLPWASLYCQAEAGETVENFLIFYQPDLEEMGIAEIGSVEFLLDIYDSDEYTGIDRTGLISLRTDIAQSLVQNVDDSGWEFYTGEDVRIVLKDVEVPNYGGCYFTVFAQNTSDRTVSLSDYGITLNEQETSGMFWTVLRPHTQTIDQIYIHDLTELGIEEAQQLEELTIELHIEYMEDPLLLDTVQETVNETVTIDLTEIVG